MQKNKLIIAGATGYIGKALCAKSPNDFETIRTSTRGGNDLLGLDFKYPENFDYNVVDSKTYVIILGAISSPDVCANQNSYAWNINVSGTKKFIEKILTQKGRVIFLSSDTIYGDCKEEVDEKFPVNPAGEYALMKSAVEQKFSNHSLFKAIRLSYVFSKTDKFTRYLIESAEQKKEVEIFHPFYRSIIHLNDVTEGIISLINKWHLFPQSIINFGGPENLSRVEFTKNLKELAIKNLKYRVSQPEDSFFMNRPRRIAMQSKILEKILERPTRNLRDAIRIEFSSN